MGEVHLAVDDRAGRDVALKMLRDEVDSDADVAVRFHREARLQGRLEHPGVVPVYDLDRDDSGRAFFVMKRVAGATFELSAFLQVCLTVDYAHSRGVLHRDIKPANLMLGDYGEVYVLDWGIARRWSAEKSWLATARGARRLRGAEREATTSSGVRRRLCARDRARPAPAL